MDTTKVIEYWQGSAKEDFITAKALFKAKRYHHTLFFCHLTLEKTLKALVVRRTKKSAPPIHDLVRLAKGAGLKLTPDQTRQLDEINTFNLRARYDEYKLNFYKKATKHYTTEWFTITKNIHRWLNKS